MKKILITLLVISAVLLTTGCHLIATNIYTRYDVNEDGVKIKVEVMHEGRDKNAITLERYYHPDGWLEREVSYVDYASGKIGYVIIFRENGSRVSAEYFNYEYDEHAVETYDENGVLLTNHTYTHGILRCVESFYPSGNRATNKSYEDPSRTYVLYTFPDVEDAEVSSIYSVWTEGGVVYSQLESDMVDKTMTRFEIKISTTTGEFIRHYVEERTPSGEHLRTTFYDANGNVIEATDNK